MATSNRVFVSPGVYTSERDLSFVSQSVGLSTLGMVGETLKGPAFEPVSVTSYNEFQSYFGGSSNEKLDGVPKHLLAYYAKSFLNQSSQLVVTRVLGYSGYDAGDSYNFKLIGQIDPSTLETVGSATVYDNIPTNSNSLDLVSYGNSTLDNILTNTIYDNGDGTTSTLLEIIESNGANIGNGEVLFVGDEFTDSNLESTGQTINHFPNTFQWLDQEFNYTSGSTTQTGYSYAVEQVSGSTDVRIVIQEFEAERYSTIHDKVVCKLRPRGRYTGETLSFPDSIDSVSSTSLGDDPYADVVITLNSGKTFTVNFNPNSKKFITKVFGRASQDKDVDQFPIYVDEIYENILDVNFSRGKIKGVNINMEVVSDGSNFKTSWTNAETPWVVSEVRGGTVNNLFKIQTISDGNSANEDIKISFININIETQEFDVLVRNFFDTDENPQILERYSRCSMNPDAPGYIAKKIGTLDGEYVLRSRYIVLHMEKDHPTDAVPAGFRGYNFDADSPTPVSYKTMYETPLDIVGYNYEGVPVFGQNEKLRKSYLGFSDRSGVDPDIFKYKGNYNQVYTSKGFHLSSQADTDTFVSSMYNFELSEDYFESANAAKFTVLPSGGFDGFDVHRTRRTNTDNYIVGKAGFMNGGFEQQGTRGNSDYYAFYDGIRTFANPEAVDINLFATPGINFFDHSSLVSESIDMVEEERADSLYIIDSPDRSTVDEVIDDLDSLGLDSNYSATYFPWIQVRDNETGTQVYVPPTGEVLRNIAYTDNVAQPWFATAGYNRGIVNAIKARKKLTLGERDDLYANRLNPIATFSDVGTIIFGNKTLQVRESALDRINVRRLLLQARKLISSVAVRLLFEQNDEIVRNEFLSLVNPILENIRRERGLTDFRVVLSDDPEDIDRNQLSGKIYIKPTRALEFIDIEFLVTPTGASFDDL